jgi:hypothetical protein
MQVHLTFNVETRADACTEMRARLPALRWASQLQHRYDLKANLRRVIHGHD